VCGRLSTEFAQRSRLARGAAHQGGRQFRLLVLAEDWCGDASNTVPYVAKLSDQARCLEMRVLRRDEHPEVMDRYLGGTSHSIPIVIVLDAAWREVEARPPR
jgi:Thioredoxin